MNYKDINEFLKSLNYSADEYWGMLDHMLFWEEWFKNDVHNFHNYTIKHGNKNIQLRRYSLGMAKTICEEYANLLLNEKVKYNIGDENQSRLIHEKILDPNSFELNVSHFSELVSAFGTGALVKSLDNIKVSKNGSVDTRNSSVKINFAKAKDIIVLSHEGRTVTECAFKTVKVVGDKKILILSLHLLQGTYKIKNYFFEVESNGSLKPTSALKGIANEFNTLSKKPWFEIWTTNIVNNISINSPYGISVFANAIDQLKGADIAYDSLVNEFILGKKRIFVSENVLKFNEHTGDPIFDETDLVYYYLQGSNYGSSDEDTPKKMIVESDMTLRIEEHEKGINMALNLLSNKCGLGFGYFKFENGSVKTATEVISDNSELYRSIRKHQIGIENTFYDFFLGLVETLNQWTTDKITTTDISIDFDDSIIEDTEAIQKRAERELNLGVIDKVHYFMETRKLTREQAIELVKEIEKGIPEEPDNEGVNA